MTKFWRNFISNGRGGFDCGHLGIEGHGVPIFPSLARRFDLIQSSGVEVWEVERGGPADQAGIQEGDIIVALAYSPTINVEKLRQLLRRLPVGVPLAVQLLRDERRLERWVVPTDYRDPAGKR
jgi:S1-C subfamily serine protease